MVNISDEICARFGFLHGDIVIKPDGVEATIQGVGSGNDGEDVLWYTIDWSQVNAPNGKGGACYWGGVKFLPDAGFVKKTSVETLKEPLENAGFAILAQGVKL